MSCSTTYVESQHTTEKVDWNLPKFESYPFFKSIGRWRDSSHSTEM